MASRKRLSGCEYKKIREAKQKCIDKQVGSFTKFLLKPTEIQQSNSSDKSLEAVFSDFKMSPNKFSLNVNNIHLTTISTAPLKSSSQDQQLNCNIDCLASTSSSITHNNSPTKEFELVSYSDTDSTDLNISIDKNIDDDSLERNILENPVDVHDDPSYWPLKLIDSVRMLFIKKGPIQIKSLNFPKNHENRKFSVAYYQRVLKNGEHFERSWLVYSINNDAVYYFCCRMFSVKLSDTGVASGIGYNDWKNLTAHLKIHEMSKTHILYYSNWQEMLIRLKLNQTIDSHNQKIIDSERKRWKAVLVRLCAILRCMAAQNLAFRGTSSVIYSPHNGNFLKLIECFSLFDNVLKDHLEKIKNKEQHVHYLGPQIQNELISLMSEKVKSNILTMVKDVKSIIYYILLYYFGLHS